MHHRCETCATCYEIPDARARGKTLRVRCTTCAGVMRVVGPGAVTWWCDLGGVAAGPFGRDDVLRRVLDGDVSAHTRMWRAGMSTWQRVSEAPELAWVFEQVLLGDDVFARAGLVSDGQGWFPDPTMKSGFIVLDDTTQRALARSARDAGLQARPTTTLWAPAIAAGLGALCAMSGVLWWLALPISS